jgi:hypothetical protein
MDVLIGLDQMEIVFSNPATIPELMTEIGRVFSVVMERLRPIVKGCYFEANIHCETEKPGAQSFLNKMIRVTSDDSTTRKGATLITQFGNDSAKLHLEVSDSIQDGLYVVFAFLSKADFRDVQSFSGLFSTLLEAYRKLQNMASVEILERNKDGSFSKRN